MTTTTEQYIPAANRRVPPAYLPDYKFSLPSEGLIDPDTNRGKVLAVTQVPAIDEYGQNLPDGIRLFEVGVEDPFIKADPEAYQAVRSYIEGIEKASISLGMNFMERSEATNDSERNEFTQAWLTDPSVQSLSVWRGLVPTAEALHFLTNPSVGETIADRGGNQGTISVETASQLRFVEDAVGIRDRGVAMSYLLKEHLLGVDRPRVDVLSLASGTAEPVLYAASEAIEETGKHVSMTVADIDSSSLQHVQSNAEKAEFKGAVNTIRANILSDRLAAKLMGKTGLESWDVVENMGFEEYLPQDGDEMGAKKGAGLPQASEFTRKAFSFVKPGGVLISGNMVYERPQRDFVFGIVDWPLINARSERSIMHVYQEAGLVGNPDVQLDMFRIINAQTGSHIYNIVRVKKLN